MFDDEPVYFVAFALVVVLLVWTLFGDSGPHDYVVATQGQCWKLSGVYLDTEDSGVSWHKAWRKGEHGPTTEVREPYRVREVIKGDFAAAQTFLKVTDCTGE